MSWASDSLETRISCAKRNWRSFNELSSRSWAIPITPLSGVRISWLMLARNWLLALLATSAAMRASPSRGVPFLNDPDLPPDGAGDSRGEEAGGCHSDRPDYQQISPRLGQGLLRLLGHAAAERRRQFRKLAMCGLVFGEAPADLENRGALRRWRLLEALAA